MGVQNSCFEEGNFIIPIENSNKFFKNCLLLVRQWDSENIGETLHCFSR